MLAILSTHPIQYQVPLWQALARDGSVPFEVWYLTAHGVNASYDQQFGKSFSWDLDLLAGYPHRFLKVNPDANVSTFNKLKLVENLKPLLREQNVSALWVQGWHVRAFWQAVRQAQSAGVPIWMRGESNDLGNSDMEATAEAVNARSIVSTSRKVPLHRGVEPSPLRSLRCVYCSNASRPLLRR